MLRTTLGSLKDEIDRYILEFVNLNPTKNRLEVPFSELLAYLQKAFLPNNDIEHVRETLECLRQCFGQSLKLFNRNFRDIAELGYPLDKRTENHKLLMKLYINRLVSHDITRTVLRASPTSLQEAMSIAIDGDELEDALYRLGHRDEEPMDVSSIVQKQKSSLKSLSRQLDKINSKLAKVKIQMQQSSCMRPN